MKNIVFSTLLIIFCAASCADKKENREEFKAEHNKDSLRNKLGESAVANSEPVNAADSSTSEVDTTQKPTNYKSMPPNTQGGGSR